jgi:pentatricopeptide repeat protein
MIDLFGRGGHFDKAVSMVGKMPSADYLPAWLALLGACQKWGKLMVGKLAFEHAVRLDRKCAVAYDLMSSIYLDAGMQENVAMVEDMRKENNAMVGRKPRFLMLMQE